MSQSSTGLGRKAVDAWWTVVAVDPIAVRVLPRLVRIRWITPNLLTSVSGVVGIGAGLAFLAGVPLAGALLFELRFFLDCLDGKVARMRNLRSAFGAYYDRQVDMATTWWSFGALSAWLVRDDVLPTSLCFLPLLTVVLWTWSNEQSLRLGGLTEEAQPEPAPGGWQAKMARHRLTALPGSVEAETLALFLAPLTTVPLVCVVALWATSAFFVVSALRNSLGLARTLRARDVASSSGMTPEPFTPDSSSDEDPG